MALLTFADVASVRRIEALIFIDTASPPASSKEELIREPLERRLRLLWRLTLVLLRLYEANEAEVLVLITTDISVVFLLRSPFRGRAVLVHCSTSVLEILLLTQFYRHEIIRPLEKFCVLL